MNHDWYIEVATTVCGERFWDFFNRARAEMQARRTRTSNATRMANFMTENQDQFTRSSGARLGGRAGRQLLNTIQREHLITSNSDIRDRFFSGQIINARTQTERLGGQQQSQGTTDTQVYALTQQIATLAQRVDGMQAQNCLLTAEVGQRAPG